MITFLKKERFILLFVAAAFIFHLFQKDLRDPYQKPIAGDAQAYYAYLPALFIYNDLEYKFMESHAAKYYPEDGIKDFRFSSNGRTVNKTFPGVAVLYTPFFLAAHLSALTFGFEADGFSNIYQLWFDLGLWFYFLFGLIFLRKLLEKLKFSSKIALFSTILIGFGTNMFFYTVYDQSVTHIHNFFMINGLLLCLVLWEEQKKNKWLIIAILLLALIGITRPTNFLVFGLIFIFFGKNTFFLSIFNTIFSKKWWIFVLPVLPVLLLPFLLWKAQTGQWIVYSYGNEGFDFAHPHFVEFIFSYTKGWLTYTPMVIPVLMLGGIALYKRSKKQLFLSLLFYLVTIYIFSSWWCWYYGAGMSQRVMIDHYVLLAFMLACALQMIWEHKFWRNGFVTVLILLGTFNVLQAHQIMIGVIKNGSTTKQGYWDSFLVLERRARVYPPDEWKLIEERTVSPEGWQSEVNEVVDYAEMVTSPISDLTPHSRLVLSFEAKALSEVEHTRAVLLLKDKATGNEVPAVYFLKAFVARDQWKLMEFAFEPTTTYTDSLKVYFWNGTTTENVQFRNVRYEHYYLE